jgi:hypothetical protein
MMRAKITTGNPINTIKVCIHQLLEEDVLDNTFGVMNQLRTACEHVAGRVGSLTLEEKSELKCLERLSSESIREALHKHELSITNAVIRYKNVILKGIGIKPDEFHQEIDPAKYNWSW